LATILVVDDEPDIVCLLRDWLENHGYAVLGAGDGKEALQVLCQEVDQVDLVITGINMPRINGFELGEQVKTEYPRLPVIYMSASGTQSIVKRARELRNSRVPEDYAFFPKPYSKEELLRAVRTVVAVQ
jgi:CheY-like chemotaxis protein